MAGINDTLANDFMVAGYDGGETVSFAAIREAGTTTYSVTYADGHTLTHREIAGSAGVFQAGDKMWCLGRNLITASANYPVKGDKITDAAGVVWVIKSAVLDELKISFECHCVRAK